MTKASLRNAVPCRRLTLFLRASDSGSVFDLISFCHLFAAIKRTTSNTLQSGHFFNCGILIQCNGFPFASEVSELAFGVNLLLVLGSASRRIPLFFRAGGVTSLA